MIEKIHHKMPASELQAMTPQVFVKKDGKPILVFFTSDKSVHVFEEVEAKKAAEECGWDRTKGDLNTRQAWKSLT